MSSASQQGQGQAVLLLKKQLRELSKNPVEGFSAGLVDDSNLFEWQVTIIGPTDTLYEGGFFNARLTFPKDYPNSPPQCRFISEMWHPNGKYCNSVGRSQEHGCGSAGR
uniref:UBC core domain-containing protein n=1 Tax=Dunaliella tertiolecta TaxID=3047 RepID=A0A7S3QS56_DUNTE